MAKRVRRSRPNFRRAGNLVTGVISSATRTLVAPGFILLTIGYILATQSTTFIDNLIALLTKLHLTKLATWVTANPEKTHGIAYSIAAATMTTPNAVSLTVSILLSTAVYYLKPAKEPTQYIGLVYIGCWAARTRSPRIRAAIGVICLLLYSYGIWGTVHEPPVNLFPVPLSFDDVKLTKTELIVSQTPIDTTQCVEVISVGPLTSLECSLPIYCGSMVYQEISSTWWGHSVGICIGLGPKPISLRIGNDNAVPTGWDMIVDVELKDPSHGRPLSTLLWNEEQGYSVMSNRFFNMFPILNITSFEYKVPDFYTIQGKHCIMQTAWSKCAIRPHIHTPSLIVWTTDPIIAHAESPDFALDYYKCWYHPSTVEVDQNSQHLLCDPAMTTTRYWPSLIQNIASTVSSAIVSIFQTTIHFMRHLFWSTMIATQFVMDYPTFIVSFFFIFRATTQLQSSAILALVLSIVIKNVIVIE